MREPLQNKSQEAFNNLFGAPMWLELVAQERAVVEKEQTLKMLEEMRRKYGQATADAK